MLHLHHANRTERLADALLRRLAEDGLRCAPLQPLTVLVPSAGVQRWLALRMADAFGVCAQVRFDFLAQWLWRTIAAHVPGVGAHSPFAAERLAWRVHAALLDAAFVEAHPRLAAYLGPADAAMRLELALQVAQVVESTVTYRPDWLARWSDGRGALPRRAEAARVDEAWQRALWRRLCDTLQLDGRHPGEAWVTRLDATGGAGLPIALHAFALPSVAPLHAELLQQAARWCDVHVYVLDPCRAYWSDLVDRKQASRLADEGRLDAHEVGHPLLASWGRQTQTLVDTWQQLGDADADADVDVDDLGDASPGAPQPADAPRRRMLGGMPLPSLPAVHEHFETAGGDRLLHRLQDGLLDLEPPVPGSLVPDDDDDSVELHVCHSTTRQVEVLHDRLLARFAADPTLRPCDVVVLTPQLDAVAPIVDAVFGTARPALALPHRVTGLARSRENAVARALLDLSALLASRAPGSALLAWIGLPVVARRLGLAADDLAALQRGLAEAGLHWGWDADHRATLGLPAGAAHTAHEAVDRLLLGHVLPRAAAVAAWRRLDAEAEAPPPGFLPADGGGGASARALGRFAALVERLRAMHRDWQRPAPPTGWAARWRAALDEFVDPSDLPDGHDALREVQAAIAELVAAMREGGGDLPLAAAAVAPALGRALDAGSPGGVPGGAITVASMHALRVLPFRVVCLVGLDDGVFPARDVPAEFDLLARAPRRGDRQRRQDDRNLFLDALLCARDHLIVTWTGRGVRDNAPLPPSVVVAELLDVLLPAVARDPYDPAALTAARRRLVVEHPLQPYAPAAFGGDPGADPRVRSHDGDAVKALRAGLVAAQAAALRAAVGAGSASSGGGTGPDDGDGHAAGRARPAAPGVPDAATGVDVDGGPGAAVPMPAVPVANASSSESDAVTVGTDTVDRDADRDGDGDDDADDPVPALPFFTGPLPPAPVDDALTAGTLGLDALQAFWRHPVRTLLRQRLRLALEPGAEAPDDDEPLVADRGLQRRWARRWLPTLVGAGPEGTAGADPAVAEAEADPRVFARLVRADTGWPHGSLSAPALDRGWRALRQLADRVRAARGTAAVVTHVAAVERVVDGRLQRLGGPFGGEGELLGAPVTGLVRWSHGGLHGGDLLSLWIAHLLLNAAPPAGWSAEGWRPHSLLVTTDGTWRLAPVDAPLPLLQTLLDLRAEGLRRPLPWFPRTSWAVACKVDGDRLVPPTAASAAASAWRRHQGGGDVEDPWLRQAFRDVADPLSGATGDAMRALAERIWAPVRVHAARVADAPAPSRASDDAATAPRPDRTGGETA